MYRYCSFFFFKQKTAYEMRISDWSSDVCPSALLVPLLRGGAARLARTCRQRRLVATRAVAMDLDATRVRASSPAGGTLRRTEHDAEDRGASRRRIIDARSGARRRRPVAGPRVDCAAGMSGRTYRAGAGGGRGATLAGMSGAAAHRDGDQPRVRAGRRVVEALGGFSAGGGKGVGEGKGVGG